MTSRPFRKVEAGTRGAAMVALAMLVASCTATGLPIDPVVSMQEAKYVDVVRQQHDFSCGAASLATLLNGYFGGHYTEQQLLSILEARYDPAAWKKKQEAGFSLEDLAYVADKLGFAAEGAVIGIAGLLQINGPVIVHLNKNGYEHFSVYRGTKDGAILLADPIFGNIQYSPGQFEAQYTDIAMAVWKKGTALPATYALMVSEKDSRGQLTQARSLLNARHEPHTIRY
jgi:uncharacterized protein